ncbi:MAG: type II toxin-antitoxin system VapC family toxin [Deltaproteobacteria bacterium]|nr:type II toxin-antitoxin system VapC family toxin [Deltaproteobacteria bacterium]
MTIYLESSFVLAYFLDEPQKPLMSIIKGGKPGVASVLTLMEVNRGLHRAENAKEIKPAERGKLSAMLMEMSSDWNLMEITPEVQRRTAETFPIEPVRTLDAIHLATALEFIKVYPDLSFATLDKRVIQNLGPLGIPQVKQ